LTATPAVRRDGLTNPAVGASALMIAFTQKSTYMMRLREFANERI